MNKILDLAQDFEQKSKQQAHDTEQRLRNEFERHEAFISEALRSSEQKIKSDIRAQNHRMGLMVLRTWLWVALSVIFVLAASSGVIWWQKTLISENFQIISKQNATIKQLDAKGGKIQMTSCGEEKRLCVKIDAKQERFGGDSEIWMIPEGY